MTAKIKERPILFSGDMVRAILSGQKTQTRRIIRNPEYFGCLTGDCPHEYQAQCNIAISDMAQQKCPYGKAGDRLWVRETFATDVAESPPIDASGNPRCREVTVFRADGDEGIYRWYPSIFMPRDVCRLILDIVSIRAERLQSISRDDCFAEGVPEDEDYPENYYAAIWDEINGVKGPKGWDANPFVWVIEFKSIA